MTKQRLLFGFAFFAILSTALVVRAQRQPGQPAAGGARHVTVSRAELMKKAPMAASAGVFRAWSVDRGNDASATLIEVDGTIPTHRHPDGAVRMYVLEGEIDATIGDQALQRLRAGDYVMIPRNTPFKLVKTSPQPALLGTVDRPPIDMSRIVWVEPRPPMSPNNQPGGQQPQQQRQQPQQP